MCHPRPLLSRFTLRLLVSLLLMSVLPAHAIGLKKQTWCVIAPDAPSTPPRVTIRGDIDVTRIDFLVKRYPVGWGSRTLYLTKDEMIAWSVSLAGCVWLVIELASVVRRTIDASRRGFEVLPSDSTR
jgi:hypothetical protein